MDVFEALQTDNVEVVEAHIAQSGDLNERLKLYGPGIPEILDGAPPLISVAAFTGACNTFEMLKNAGADMSVTDSWGARVVHFWAAGGNDDIFDILDREGTDFQAEDRRGNTVFHYAAKYGQKSVFTRLAVRGFDMGKANSDNQTPFFVFAKQDRPATREMMETLAEYVNVNETPALTALVEREQLEALEVIIGTANFTSVSIDGMSAVFWAVRNDKRELVRILLKSKTAAKVGDKYGRTILHWAAANGNLQAIRDMIDAYDDVNITTKSGMTAMHLAKNRKHEDVVQFLESRGGKLFVP